MTAQSIDGRKTLAAGSPSGIARLMRSVLRPYRNGLLGIILLQFGQAFAALLLPTLNADIVDDGILSGRTSYMLRVGAEMLGISIIQVAAALGATYVAGQVATAVGRDLRLAIFDRVQSLSVAEVGRLGVASLTTRVTNDVQQVQLLCVMTLTMMVSAPLMCVGGIVLAVRESPRLSWLIAVVLPMLLVTVAVIIRAMRPLSETMQRELDGASQILREQVTGVAVVRTFGKDRYEQQRFDEQSDRLMHAALGTGRVMATFYPTALLVMNASSVAVLWFGGHLVGNGTMQVGVIGAFLNYLMQILMSVMAATFMVGQLPRGTASARRINHILDTPLAAPSSARLDGPVPQRSRDAAVELRGVQFIYGQAAEPVLRDINLRINRGSTTAVIGSTGSGKSTLLHLIARLADPSAGQVLLDGVDVREISDVHRRQIVSLAPQRAFLFAGTVASNLRQAAPEASDEELWHVLDVAQARRFVEALPGGLQAPVAPSGRNFSGGQRHRLAIARTLLTGARTLLFDESLAALDVVTERELRTSLATAFDGATLIVVTSRLGALRAADQVVVLEEGRVVGTGSHDELMADSSVYREFVQAQMSGANA